jgi:hypothetical protein
VEEPPPAPAAPAEDTSRDADPSELYMKDDGRKKPRKPRNKRHGRNR